MKSLGRGIEQAAAGNIRPLPWVTDIKDNNVNTFLAKYSKLLGAVLGVVASVPVNTLVPGINPAWATVITGLLAAAGAYFAPKNAG